MEPLSRRDEEEDGVLLSFRKLEDWKDGLEDLFEEEAEHIADVNFGIDFAISMLADWEASVDDFSARLKRRSLSYSFSEANDEERRAFL